MVGRSSIFFALLLANSALLVAACAEDSAGGSSPGSGGTTVTQGGSSAAGASAGGAGGATAGTGGAAAGGMSTTGGSAGTSSGGASTGTCLNFGAEADRATVDYGAATAPAAAWANITGTLAGTASDCGQLNGVHPSPWTDMLVVAVNRQGLYSSADGGDTYTKIGTTGDKILNAAMTILWDPIHPSVFWEAGIYGWKNPWTLGVFYTLDSGASFKGFLDLAITEADCMTNPPCGQSHNDSVSVDFTDPCRLTMVAGGHEQKNTLFITHDGFQTFTDKANFPAGLGFCTNALVIDSMNFVVGCGAAFNGGSAGTVRSSDGGTTWTQVSNKGGVGQYLWASDDSIYWRADGGGMIKTTDHGVTWTEVAAAGVAGTTNPIELPDGRIVSAGGTTIKISADHGASWQPVGTTLPYEASGLSYSPFRKAFYTWRSDCGGTVLSDAIMRSGWDYTTQ